MANVVKEKDTLNDFLRKKKDDSSSPIDWSVRKANWIGEVKDLYQFLTDQLLKELIEEKVIEVSQSCTQVSEEYVGTYEIPELNLKVGNNHVVFSPVAVNVIGAAGRVDIRGDRDTVTLILDRKSTSPDERWKIVLARVPRVATAPLDSHSLKAALERVML